jgi:hypothetical protein
MKIAVAVLVLCASAQSALAKEPDCRSIENANGRLACYDAASPPKAAKPAAIESGASRPPFTDPFIAEDARTTAKLKKYLSRLLKPAGGRRSPAFHNGGTSRNTV